MDTTEISLISSNGRGIEPDEFEFSNGTLYASIYSYEIDTFADMELTKIQTAKLFLAMRNFYNQNPELLNLESEKSDQESDAN